MKAKRNRVVVCPFTSFTSLFSHTAEFELRLPVKKVESLEECAQEVAKQDVALVVIGIDKYVERVERNKNSVSQEETKSLDWKLPEEAKQKISELITDNPQVAFLLAAGHPERRIPGRTGLQLESLHSR